MILNVSISNPQTRFWAATFTSPRMLPKVGAKNFPRGKLLGSKALHRGGAAQSKPENITEGKEATHSPHSKWRRKLFYEECNTKNISVNAGYINNSCK